MFARCSTNVSAALGRGLGGLALVLGAGTVLAWGPHTEITQAAVDALGTNDALAQWLGAQTPRLTNYCWLGDYHRLVFQEQDELFYADDYLLFPGATPQWEHTGTWLKKTFRPYYQRAVQALRTETPANAARWIGSLVHFVEDAGAPPHALALRGGAHTRMESWIETSLIQIPDHRPQLLGGTAEQALETLLKRLEALDEFAKVRGKKLRPLVELGNHKGVKALELECALECSRLVADLLHTLGQVALGPITNSAGLSGTMASRPAPGVERFPTKLVFEGTNFSTLTDLAGRYAFHHLPTGTWHIVAFRPGGGSARFTVDLPADRTNECHLTLAPHPTNLVRNGDFKLNWAAPKAPDCWYPTKEGWEGEFIPLKDGQRYRLTAHFKRRALGSVLVRWTERFDRPKPAFMLMPRFDTRTLTPVDNQWIFTASRANGVVQLVLKETALPGIVFTNVVLEPLGEEPQRNQ